MLSVIDSSPLLSAGRIDQCIMNFTRADVPSSDGRIAKAAKFHNGIGQTRTVMSS